MVLAKLTCESSPFAGTFAKSRRDIKLRHRQPKENPIAPCEVVQQQSDLCYFSVPLSRTGLYQRARQNAPARWSSRTRDWTPVGAVTLNPERETAIQAAIAQRKLSGSAGAPAFPSRPEKNNAGARSEGQERGGATRSHAQRPLRREHGEDGEHRTLPEASTLASSTTPGATGHRPRGLD